MALMFAAIACVVSVAIIVVFGYLSSESSKYRLPGPTNHAPSAIEALVRCFAVLVGISNVR